MNQEILQTLETLEALYFLTQSIDGKPLQDITGMRESLSPLSRQARRELFAAIKKDIKKLRAYYGAIAADSKFRELLADARRRPGYAYLPKNFIDRKLFRNYEKVFPRWPHVPQHALIVFDGQANRSMHQIFTLEGALFSDAQILLKSAREVHKGIGDKDFRKRAKEDQLALLAYLRSLVATILHFLEAYLNGLAYDCFQMYHDKLSLTDHDFLAEWDSKSNRRRFARFEEKVLRYPVVVGKTLGRNLEVSTINATQLLLDYGKRLRDALTHPSPYVDS
jgi:hypothetical protein